MKFDSVEDAMEQLSKNPSFVNAQTRTAAAVVSQFILIRDSLINRAASDDTLLDDVNQVAAQLTAGVFAGASD